MNVEIGTETPLFFFWDFFSPIVGILSLQCMQQYYVNIFVILCTYKSFQYFRIWHALQHNCQRKKWQTVPQCNICEVLQRILLKSNQNRQNNFVAPLMSLMSLRMRSSQGGWDLAKLRMRSSLLRMRSSQGEWDLANCGWDLANCGWDLANCGWNLAHCGWDLANCGWDLAKLRMRPSQLRMKSSQLRMRCSQVRMRSSQLRMRSSQLRMRSSQLRMRSCKDVCKNIFRSTHKQDTSNTDYTGFADFSYNELANYLHIISRFCCSLRCRHNLAIADEI